MNTTKCRTMSVFSPTAQINSHIDPLPLQHGSLVVNYHALNCTFLLLVPLSRGLIVLPIWDVTVVRGRCFVVHEGRKDFERGKKRVFCILRMKEGLWIKEREKNGKRFLFYGMMEGLWIMKSNMVGVLNG